MLHLSVRVPPFEVPATEVPLSAVPAFAVPSFDVSRPVPTVPRPHRPTRRLHVDLARCSATRCPGHGAAPLRPGTTSRRV